MKHVDTSKPISFESASLPNRSYSFSDSGNNRVVVNQPDPENHTPHNGVPQEPAVFANVGFGVANYDSKQTHSIEENSAIVVYECHDFYDKINHPNKINKKGYALVVVVRYGDDKAGNYTKTFYDKPGGIF